MVRVDQTFYGGFPRKAKKKMVHFNLVPNSVFSPRLRSLSSIIKRDKNVTQEVAQIKCTKFLPDVETIASKADKHQHALKYRVHSGKKREQLTSFGPCVTKDDFASMCLRATQDFIVTKELVTNSRTLKSLTFFTLRRKDNPVENNEIAWTMKDFYTSASVFDYSKDSPALTPLLEMEI